MADVPATCEQRQLRPEIMDDPRLPVDEHLQALRGLARINRWTRSAALLWKPLRQHLRASQPFQIRLLDVACGSGDVLISLAKRLRRDRIRFELTGCDISDRAVAAARRRAAGIAGVRFVQCDVLRDSLPTGFDVLTCSLFLHHLDDRDARTVLEKMGKAAGELLIVSDLIRSSANVMLVALASRLLSRSHVVHFDGPQSVRAAFTIAELKALAVDAGLIGAKMQSTPPCRALLTWRRQ